MEKKVEILIDQGTEDPYLKDQQLQTEEFKKSCEKINYPLNLRYQIGYDHGYYFITSFIDDHIEHHAKYL